LGLIEYKAKNYSESLVFLSQLYTDYPKSSFVPEGLFYIGLSFSQQKKTEEAALSWNEVIKKFPKSAPAKMAKEKLTALR